MQSWRNHARHRDTRGIAAMWLIAAALSTTALTPACGEEFTSCAARKTCPPEPESPEAGAGGSPSDGGAPSGSGTAGDTDSTFAGASGAADSGAGGAPGGPSGRDAGAGSGPDPSDGGAGDSAVAALEVVSMDPPDGTVDVDRMPTITIEFSERVDPRTITEANLSFTCAGRDIEKRMTTTGAVVTLSPLADLDLLTQCTVSVSESAKAITGGNLSAPYESSLVVRDGILREPVRLKELQGSIYDEASAIGNEKGDLLVTIRGDATTPVSATFFDAAKRTWTQLQNVPGAPLGAKPRDSALNSAGQGMLAWRSAESGTAVFSPVSGWSVPYFQPAPNFDFL